MILKSSKSSVTYRNYAVTHCQTLEEVPWLLRQEKPEKEKNIAGRLPENSRNRFVDRQSKKNSKKDRPKKFVFSLKADLIYFD